MSDPGLTFLERVEAYARTFAPELALAYLGMIRALARAFSEGRIADLITAGNIDAVAVAIASQPAIAQASVAFREVLRQSVERAGKYFTRDTPIAARKTGIARVEFARLDDRVLQAVKEFEGKVLGTLKDDIRGAVKEAIEEGIRAGVNPRTIARELRDVVGLAAHQERWVLNYRRELNALDPGALLRELRDGRYDRTIRAAIRDGTPLSAEQIDRMVEAYRRRVLSSQAETVSRTASLNAIKEGQRLAWEQAIAEGRVDRGDLIDEWHTKLDGRERPTHHDMNGQTKAFDALWDVPGVGLQRYPGESEFNCRCTTFTRPRIRRASELVG